MTQEDIELTQSATLQECVDMINQVADLFKVYLETSEYKVEVKYYMTVNAIIWRLCNEDEAEPLFQHYVHVMN